MLFPIKNIVIFIRANLLVTLFFASIFGCSDVPKTSEQNKKQENVNTAEISKEEAVVIAKRYISSDYNVEFYDAVIHDRKTYWGIEFVFKEEYKHRTGGGAVVEIDKKSGKIIREYFAK